MISQRKINDVVIMAKAKAVELGSFLTEVGNDGSYKFRKLRGRLMYLMSYIQILEGYQKDSGLLRREDIIRTIELIDLIVMEEL